MAMGMRAAFSPNQAGLSGLSPNPLFIEAAVHEAFIDVNEEGTEAAAAAGVVVGLVSMPPSIRADRPFLFFILEKSTQTLLFMGRFVRPSA